MCNINVLFSYLCTFYLIFSSNASLSYFFDSCRFSDKGCNILAGAVYLMEHVARVTFSSTMFLPLMIKIDSNSNLHFCCVTGKSFGSFRDSICCLEQHQLQSHEKSLERLPRLVSSQHLPNYSTAPMCWLLWLYKNYCCNE